MPIPKFKAKKRARRFLETPSSLSGLLHSLLKLWMLENRRRMLRKGQSPWRLSSPRNWQFLALFKSQVDPLKLEQAPHKPVSLLLPILALSLTLMSLLRSPSAWRATILWTVNLLEGQWVKLVSVWGVSPHLSWTTSVRGAVWCPHWRSVALTAAVWQAKQDLQPILFQG